MQNYGYQIPIIYTNKNYVKFLKTATGNATQTAIMQNRFFEYLHINGYIWVVRNLVNANLK